MFGLKCYYLGLFFCYCMSGNDWSHIFKFYLVFSKCNLSLHGYSTVMPMDCKWYSTTFFCLILKIMSCLYLIQFDLDLLHLCLSFNSDSPS